MTNSIPFYHLFILSLFLLSCNNQHSTASTHTKLKQAEVPIKYGAGDVVTKGFLDQSGNMWFTTTKEGVFRYDGKSFTNFTVEDGLCDNQVWAILQDNEGLMWFGTASGLCRYDGKSFQNIPIPTYDLTSDWLESVYPIVNPNAVTSLIQDQKGDFWIGSNGAGAYHYDGKTFTSFLKAKGKLMPDSLHHNVVLSIIEDLAGNIWFTSFSHGGVSRYDGESFTHYGIPEGLGDDMIASSYIDKRDVLWFGTRAGGMSRWEGKTFSTVYEPEGRCQNHMATLHEDKKGRFWVASYARKGVCFFDGESFTPFDIPGSENLNDVKFISEDKNGNIWFGGRYGLLWQYDGKRLIDFTQKGRS